MAVEHVLGDDNQSLAAVGHSHEDGVSDVAARGETQAMHHHTQVELVL